MRSIRPQIERIRKSKDAKIVGANVFYLTLLQFGGYIFPFITLPYLAKVIGVTGFGKIAFASAIIGYCLTLTNWGFNYTTTRDIAKNRDDILEVKRIYSTVTWARIILMCIVSIILILLILTVPYLRDNAPVILFTLLLVPANVLFPEWLFQGMEEMKYITYLNFGTRLIFTCLVFVFIKGPEDYLLQPLLMSFGSLFASCLGIVFIWKRWKIKLCFIPFKNIWDAIKQTTDVFLNTLMPNFYNSFSVVLLGFWGGSVANGYYDGGNKFNAVITEIMMVISRAFFPFLARKINKHDLFAKLSLISAAICSILTFLLAPWLIKTFLSESFDQSIIVLRILSVSIFFLVMSSVYGTNYLILIGKERLLRNTTFVASIIGFTIAIPMVYFFQYIGAAITITVSRLLMGVFTYVSALKVKHQLQVINEA